MSIQKSEGIMTTKSTSHSWSMSKIRVSDKEIKFLEQVKKRFASFYEKLRFQHLPGLEEMYTCLQIGQRLRQHQCKEESNKVLHI